MVRVSVDEIRRNPGKYLQDVEAGEVVVVTRADQAVAEIRPVTADKAPSGLRPSGLAAGQFRTPETLMRHSRRKCSTRSRADEGPSRHARLPLVYQR